MKRFLASWVVCLSAIGGCAVPPPQRLQWVATGNLEKVGLQVFWEATSSDLDLRGGEDLQWVRRLDETVYVLTTGNRLIALDAATGVFRWTVRVAREGERVYPPRHASAVSLSEKLPGVAELMDPAKTVALPPFDAAVVGSSSQVMVIDRKNGRVLRQVDLEHGTSSAGATDGIFSTAVPPPITS